VKNNGQSIDQKMAVSIAQHFIAVNTAGGIFNIQYVCCCRNPAIAIMPARSVYAGVKTLGRLRRQRGLRVADRLGAVTASAWNGGC
jgi:hypothetical protein